MGSGISARASGKATNARPGPPSTTWSTGLPVANAMCPKTPNTTKPDRIEQAEFDSGLDDQLFTLRELER